MLNNPNTETVQGTLDHLTTSMLHSKQQTNPRKNKNKYSNNKTKQKDMKDNILNQKFWHEDKSKDGKFIKNYYRQEIRRHQRKQIDAKITKITKQINAYFVEKNKTNFWNNISKLNTTRTPIDISIDTLTSHYTTILNVAEINTTYDMPTLELRIQEYLDKENNNIGEIQLDEVLLVKIINSLKCGKARGFCDIENECYKYANHNTIIPILKMFFETIINYKINVANINIGVLFPLIKDRKGKNDDINNIRPITLSDTIAIILEKLLLSVLNKYISIHELQFGFVQNSSTQHALYVFKENILHHQTMNIPLYICFLDFSKAFDKINKTILLHKLYDQINIFFWIMLYNYINHAHIIIRNNGKNSAFIKVTRGVKQGGPASPTLFAIYINKMIIEVVKLGLVCTMYKITVGVVCYADDTTITSYSLLDLKFNLIKISQYCKEHEIKLNENKTKWMYIGKPTHKETLTINNKEIEQVHNFKLLGYWFNDKLKSHDHINNRITKCRNSSFALNKLGFSTYKMKYGIKTFLYNTYCRATLKYGIENTHFNQTQLKLLQTQEGIILKRALMLSKYSSTTKLFKALEIEPITSIIKSHKLKFILRLAENQLTKRLLDNQCKDYDHLHKESLVKDVIVNYLTEPGDITNSDQLINKIKDELSEIKSNELEDEIENIKYLLCNRNKYNNASLVHMLQPRNGAG